MEKIKISVIIPIFNMARWIEHAIETVENQTLKEIEIICVDDGSTDNSLDILCACAEKNNNLVVLHQDNQGAALAKNRGIACARGEYLAFLDADDYYYAEDALEYLYRKATENKAKICCGSFCDNRNGILSFTGFRPERSFQKEGFLTKRDFPGPTGYCSSIFLRDLLIKNNIRFPALRRGEDGVFFVEAIAKAEKAYCTEKIVYVYRKDHKDVLYTEEKAVALVRGNYEILRIAAQNGMDRVFAAWKKECYGEMEAMLYKYAAAGNPDMMELAVKLNTLIGGGLREGKEIVSYVDTVQQEKPKFLEDLKSLETVYVFGAGTVGRRVVTFLKENNVKLTAVIVSDPAQNPKSIAGVPVESIEMVDLSQNYTVIIATFWYLREEIIRNLEEHGVKNYSPLDLCAFHLWQDEIIH